MFGKNNEMPPVVDNNTENYEAKRNDITERVTNDSEKKSLLARAWSGIRENKVFAIGMAAFAALSIKGAYDAFSHPIQVNQPELSKDEKGYIQSYTAGKEKYEELKKIKHDMMQKDQEAKTNNVNHVEQGK